MQFPHNDHNVDLTLRMHGSLEVSAVFSGLATARVNFIRKLGIYFRE